MNFPILHYCHLEDLENAVMAHRYLYNVVGLPVLSDTQYNILAAVARQRLPITFKAHCPGSLYSSAEDFTEAQRLIAIKILSDS